MATRGAASCSCTRQLLLVAAVLGLMAAGNVAGQHRPTKLQQQELELGSVAETTQLAEVDEIPLVQLAGCKLSRSDSSYELPPGMLDKCSIRLDNLGQRQPKLIMFDVAEDAEMTVSIMLSAQGGTASMSLWYPSEPADQPPNQLAKELVISQATTEAFITISPETIATNPGRFTLRVTAFTGNPVSAVLRVNTPGPGTQLAAGDARVMNELAKTCCQGNVTESAFCSVIAPTALSAQHDWSHDLCHFAPTSCNAKGQLTQLLLPVLGLSCPELPASLASLPALRRLDLSGNSLDGVTADDAAKALAGAAALQELSLGKTALSGSLSCAFTELPSLKVLDLSYNFLDGPLPSCLLRDLQELYVPGNDLSGGLVAWPAASSLVTLYANQQRGKGLTGPLPPTLSSQKQLRFLNIGGNSMSGPLPALPPALQLLNISGNSFNGTIRELPAAIWVLDASGNKLSGALPPLRRYQHLEVAVASDNPLQGSVPLLPASLHQLELVGCGLTGGLPALPLALRRLDLSDNQLTGDISSLDASRLEVLRLASNRFTGVLPASVSSSQALFLLDLHGNTIGGSLPTSWSTPRLQMVMLENNTLTGTLPPALAGLRNLGVLRLADNKLSGGLSDFAAQLKDPVALSAAALAAGEPRATGFSSIFELDLTNNQLTGPVPEQLSFLGVFNPNLTVVVPGPGGPASAPRVLDLSGNKFAGEWPSWLLPMVPQVASVCSCSVRVTLDGPGMQLECPEGEVPVTDYMWQIAAQMRYSCWDGRQHQQLLDFLSSPANSLDRADPLITTRGDGGGLLQHQARAKLPPGAVAGAVVGCLLGVVLLGLAAYFLVYKRLVQPRQAGAFKKFQDDPAAAAGAAAGASVSGAGSDVERRLPTSTAGKAPPSSGGGSVPGGPGAQRGAAGGQLREVEVAALGPAK